MEIISHEGVVKEITPDVIKVTIVSKSACSGCHAKGFCSASEMQEKVIEIKRGKTTDGTGYSTVPTQSQAEEYHIGESVSVNMEQRLGNKAVWIVYVIPVVILLILLLYLQRFVTNELYLGLIVMGAVALYFFILYLFRGKVGRGFYFTISKLQDTNR
ncbi:MAG TPA: SoxR reducing system RseC family protein [Candidatus Egerieousia sp.]|nr:SoxR reducing system RseC family protein [Candidatus Egerieousia sp.]HPT05108.1 SoxR reducing system RseC family protein [Candidatus Egerieousia sp.]